MLATGETGGGGEAYTGTFLTFPSIFLNLKLLPKKSINFLKSSCIALSNA